MTTDSLYFDPRPLDLPAHEVEACARGEKGAHWIPVDPQPEVIHGWSHPDVLDPEGDGIHFEHGTVRRGSILIYVNDLAWKLCPFGGIGARVHVREPVTRFRYRVTGVQLLQLSEAHEGDGIRYGFGPAQLLDRTAPGWETPLAALQTSWRILHGRWSADRWAWAIDLIDLDEWESPGVRQAVPGGFVTRSPRELDPGTLQAWEASGMGYVGVERQAFARALLWPKFGRLLAGVLSQVDKLYAFDPLKLDGAGGLSDLGLALQRALAVPGREAAAREADWHALVHVRALAYAREIPMQRLV